MTSTSDAYISRSLRKDNQVYLVGSITNQITGSKLPSNRQVLLVLFHNMRLVGLNLTDSAKLVIKEVTVFWEKARIETKRLDHCVKKLIDLHKKWRDIQKLASRKSEPAIQKTQDFQNNLDDLFDIAHQDAISLTKNKEDAEFLKLQRQKGRPGFMAGVDFKSVEAEERKKAKAERTEIFKKRKWEEMYQEAKAVELTSSSSADSILSNISDSNFHNDATNETQQPSVSRRGSTEFFTSRLAAALDKCKISDRNATHLLIAAAESFKCDVNKLIINRKSINTRRKKFRELRYSQIKDQFKLSGCETLVLHWDGKLLPAIKGVEKIDRLAVLVTFDDKEQLLGVPVIESSSGQDQSAAVYEAVQDWEVTDKVKALCFDTTASNTGRINGACAKLEALLDRDLLYLPCRHHIFELVLKAVFETAMGQTTAAPQVLIFKRFQEQWANIDCTKYNTGVEEQSVLNQLGQTPEDSLNLIQHFLKEKHCRDDYRELLELAIIFLGGLPPRGIKFRIPGAISHARWMAKAIYGLKIYLFRKQFKLTKKEEEGLRRVCIFVVKIYLRAWYSAPYAAKAPFQDLQFLKNLVNYESTDTEISKAAIKKFKNHLWYLSPENVAFAFFDEDVSDEEKQVMAASLKSDEDTEDEFQEFETGAKKVNLTEQQLKNINDRTIASFVTPESRKFFLRFSIDLKFLDEPPSTWICDENYLEGRNLLKSMRVVNDVAERGIKLIEEYNNILTKNEEERQYVLQFVKDYRGKYPVANKSCLTSN